MPRVMGSGSILLVHTQSQVRRLAEPAARFVIIHEARQLRSCESINYTTLPT